MLHYGLVLSPITKARPNHGTAFYPLHILQACNLTNFLKTKLTQSATLRPAEVSGASLNGTGNGDQDEREGDLAFILVFICCGLFGFIILVMVCSRHKTTKQERQARKYVSAVERQRRKSMEALVRSSIRTGTFMHNDPPKSAEQLVPLKKLNKETAKQYEKDSPPPGPRSPTVVTFLPSIRVERSDGKVEPAAVDG